MTLPNLLIAIVIVTGVSTLEAVDGLLGVPSPSWVHVALIAASAMATGVFLATYPARLSRVRRHTTRSPRPHSAVHPKENVK